MRRSSEPHSFESTSFQFPSFASRRDIFFDLVPIACLHSLQLLDIEVAPHERHAMMPPLALPTYVSTLVLCICPLSHSR